MFFYSKIIYEHVSLILDKGNLLREWSVCFLRALKFSVFTKPVNLPYKFPGLIYWMKGSSIIRRVFNRTLPCHSLRGFHFIWTAVVSSMWGIFLQPRHLSPCTGVSVFSLSLCLSVSVSVHLSHLTSLSVL